MTPAEREALIREGTALAQRAMVNLDAASEAELARLYRQAAGELRELIAGHADPDGGLSLLQLRNLLDQVEGRLGQLAAARDQALNSGLRVAAELGAQPFLNAGVEASVLMRVPDEALRFVRAFVAADGLQLSDRLWRIDRGARDAVVNAIERAVVMGQGASQAAQEFLNSGRAVPADVQAKLRAAGALGVGREATAIMTGDRAGGGAMFQAQRVMRTEINRAHGVAYMSQAEKTPGFLGFQFTLSPAHPKADICDELAAADSFGLGKGVYPDMAAFTKVWPAHPNTLSFPVAIFDTAVETNNMAGSDQRDDLTRTYFNDKNISVSGRYKTRNFEHGPFDDESIKMLIGAPDDSRIQVIERSNRVDIELFNDLFAQPRSIFIDRYATVHWNGFFLKDSAPEGIGTRIAATSLLTANQLGIPAVEMTAWGKPSYNGSYTWARMGFDAVFSAADRIRLERDGFARVEAVSDLMKTEAGREYWRNNGWNMEMRFDPSDGSQSMQTLQRYLDERGVVL